MVVANFGDRIGNSIGDFYIFVDELREGNQLQKPRTSKFQKSSNWDDQCTGYNACTPLALGQWSGSSKEEQPLDHHDLEARHKSNREPEVRIELREYLFKNVDFSLADLPAVDVVKHLREHKRAKHISEQF